MRTTKNDKKQTNKPHSTNNKANKLTRSHKEHKT